MSCLLPPHIVNKLSGLVRSAEVREPTSNDSYNVNHPVTVELDLTYILHTTHGHDTRSALVMNELALSGTAEREVAPLPPTDRGRQAWSFVAAGFAIETLLWGGLFSTGVFLKYYAAHEVGYHTVL